MSSSFFKQSSCNVPRPPPRTLQDFCRPQEAVFAGLLSRSSSTLQDDCRCAWGPRQPGRGGAHCSEIHRNSEPEFQTGGFPPVSRRRPHAGPFYLAIMTCRRPGRTGGGQSAVVSSWGDYIPMIHILSREKKGRGRGASRLMVFGRLRFAPANRRLPRGFGGPLILNLCIVVYTRIVNEAGGHFGNV